MGGSVFREGKNFLYSFFCVNFDKFLETTEEKGHFIFKFDWIRSENGGLEFINK